MTKTYIITGMTCEHCAASVREEIQEVPGVSHVEVTLTAGTAIVDGENFDDSRVLTAIAEAGYDGNPA